MIDREVALCSLDSQCWEQLLTRLGRCQASSKYLPLQVCFSRQRVGWAFPLEDQLQFKSKTQVIASATTTCTSMMSSILGLLTSTCPRANAERERGIQSIAGLLVFGNFSPTMNTEWFCIVHCLGVMWTIPTLAVTQHFKKVLLITGHARFAQVIISYILDAIASPITYPWVSQSLIDSFRLEIAIASLSFASLLSLETRLSAALAQVLTPCLMCLMCLSLKTVQCQKNM